MRITPSSEEKPKRTFQELLSSVTFKPQSIEYKPTIELIKSLLRKHRLFGFNMAQILEECINRSCKDDEEVEFYIEELSYQIQTECKYCYNQGCRICLGIDL